MSVSLPKFASFAAAALLWSGSAFAGSATFTLHRIAALTNVTDTAGTTQHEAGTILQGTTTVGNFQIERRVDTIQNPLFNTGATKVVLFFAAKRGTTAAPENITIEGAHDFTTGAFKGSVSATSSAYSWVRDADANYTIASTTETLVIQWTGSNQLTLP